MATDLQARPRLAITQSLPPHLERLASSLGTVKWPGQATRLHLQGGMELSEAHREEAKSLLTELRATVTGSYLGQQNIARARLALLTKMLMGFPTAGDTSEQAAAARLDVYDDALAEMPPWAIAAAVKRWIRGECNGLEMGVLNYNFAPGPAILRRLCMDELHPLQTQINKLTRLLASTSLDRAMDPTPIERRPDTSITDQSGRRIAIGLKRI